MDDPGVSVASVSSTRVCGGAVADSKIDVTACAVSNWWEELSRQRTKAGDMGTPVQASFLCLRS